MFNFKQALDLTIARLFSIEGRAPRSEYWWAYLALVVIFIVLNMITAMFGAVSSTLGGLVSLAASLISLALTIVIVFAGIRRLHDRDMSGWWMLIALVPVLGGIALLVLLALPGTVGPNRFGNDPLADLMGHYNYYTSKQHKNFGAFGSGSLFGNFNFGGNNQQQPGAGGPNAGGSPFGGAAPNGQQPFQNAGPQGGPQPFAQNGAPQPPQPPQAPQSFQQNGMPQPPQPPEAPNPFQNRQ